VTYYDSNPNQALNITKIDLTIGFMGSAEQISITNIAFDDTTNTIGVMVQNTGSTTVSITQAFVNGVAAALTAPIAIPNSSSVTINIPLPASISFDPGASYTIKLITAKGSSVVNTATYNP
jgi:urease beta subunit